MGCFGRREKIRQRVNSDAGVRSEKSSLEMIERRILAVGGDIQKANREIAGLKTDLQKKTGELRAIDGVGIIVGMENTNLNTQAENDKKAVLPCRWR